MEEDIKFHLRQSSTVGQAMVLEVIGKGINVDNTHRERLPAAEDSGKVTIRQSNKKKIQKG